MLQLSTTAQNVRGLDSSNLSDPKVFISVEENDKVKSMSKLYTEVSERTTNPYWMKEFVVSWRTNRCWIRFDVVDRVRIFPDKPLGTCFFDVSQLRVGETREVWMPLFDTKVATRLESPSVTVWDNLSSSTPQPIVEPSFTPTPGGFDSSAGAGMQEAVTNSITPTPSSTPSTADVPKLPHSEWGHLHVIFDFRPFPEPPRNMLMELPQLRVALEKPFYRPGELIRGMVFYNVAAKAMLKSLNVFMKGESRVHWTESNGDNTDWYQSQSEFLKESHPVLAPPEGFKSLSIEHRHICAAFDFVLPIGLPSSSDGKITRGFVTTKTGYRIGATAELAGRTVTADLPLIVLPHYQEDSNASLLPSITPQPIFIPDTTPIRYTIIVPRVLTAGSRFSATITVDNTNGKVAITKLSFAVQELQIAYAEHLRWYSKRGVFKLSSVTLSEPSIAKGDWIPHESLPIPPGETRKFIVNMSIPKDTENSILPGECPLYLTQHVFTASTHERFDKGVKDDMAYTPIIISGCGLPEGYQHFKASSAAASDPNNPNAFFGHPITDPPVEHIRPYAEWAVVKVVQEGPMYPIPDVPVPSPFRAHVFPPDTPLTNHWLPITPWTGGKPPNTAISVYSIPPN